MTILSFTLESTSGDPVPQFTISNSSSLPLALPAGSAGVVYEVLFEPTSAGLHTADLVVAAQHAGIPPSPIESTIALASRTLPLPTETDSFVATSALSYPLLDNPAFESGISVVINGTLVAQFDGPDQPDWTYDKSENAIVFTPRVYLMPGEAVEVTYPVSCK